LIEILNQTILWWHWIAIGFILLIIEMNTGTFVMLGLALSAIVVGLIDISIHTNFTTEIIIWTVLSVLSLWAWRKWAKVEDVSNSGQSNYNLDTMGTVTKSITPHNRGKVTFDTPVLGTTTWTATATQNITKDTRVQIVAIHGQLIEVENTNINI
jgi:membrane protein implicated in regulation of membrane protease activity